MLIVDANMVISALLSPNGRPAELFIIVPKGLMIAPDFLKKEIQKHHLKLLKFFTKGNDRTEEDFEDAKADILNRIIFYSDAILPESVLKQAEELVADIDPKDSPYVAFALFFSTQIWSGDKVLAEGLKAKGFDLTLTTAEVAIANLK